MRTIAVINRKGGSGKTTTAVNTAAALAGLGHPALLIDVDPQGSASDWLDREGNDRGLREAFTVTGDLGRLAVPTDTAGLDIVPSTQWLVTAEKTMLGDLSVGISRALQRIPPRWDFVIVDCPPSLSYLAIGVMMGVRELVIPVEAHSMAFTGAVEVMDELPAVRKLNPSLSSILLLPCRVTRTRHARGVIEALERRLSGRGHDGADPREHHARGGRRRAATDHAPTRPTASALRTTGNSRGSC